MGNKLTKSAQREEMCMSTPLLKHSQYGHFRYNCRPMVQIFTLLVRIVCNLIQGIVCTVISEESPGNAAFFSGVPGRIRKEKQSKLS